MPETSSFPSLLTIIIISCSTPIQANLCLSYTIEWKNICSDLTSKTFKWPIILHIWAERMCYSSDLDQSNYYWLLLGDDAEPWSCSNAVIIDDMKNSHHWYCAGFLSNQSYNRYTNKNAYYQWISWHCTAHSVFKSYTEIKRKVKLL